MPELTETHVVTCFLRNRGEVLLLRRSGEVGSYQQKWGGVAGHAEGDPDAAARREIDEETGLGAAATFARKGEPFDVEDADLDKRWIVHPYLFDCAHRDVQLDWESTEAAWVPPTEILRRETVPALWTSYGHVAPSVETIRNDHEHGAAYLSIRALEVLRDRAGVLAHQTGEDAQDELRTLAHALLEVRPTMAVLRNRIHRVMHTCGQNPSAEAVEQAAHNAIGRALDADAEAARRAAEQVAGQRVLTLSRSGTVMAALRQAEPSPSVIVAASWPMGEGVVVGEELAEAGLDVTLIPDAALAYAAAERDIDLVLTGADAVLPAGAVVNKTGTRLTALVARHEDAPFYAACAADKVCPAARVELETGDPAAVYDGDAALNVHNPMFEETPSDLVTGVITERGVLAPDEVEAMAADLQALANWDVDA